MAGQSTLAATCVYILGDTKRRDKMIGAGGRHGWPEMDGWGRGRCRRQGMAGAGGGENTERHL